MFRVSEASRGYIVATLMQCIRCGKRRIESAVKFEKSETDRRKHPH